MTSPSLGLALILAVQVAGTTPDQPTPEQIEWISKNAIVVETADAGSGFDDLMPLKELIGDARIVALGEGTHGTREFFRMKHRLVEFLASEMGFAIFSIEANMPEAYRLNDFVLKGEGDPKTGLRGMYFWTWNTQEVLDMVLWMREFNKSGRGQIQFTGFDMQTPDVAMEVVLDFLSDVDDGYEDKTEEIYDAVKSAHAKGGAGGFGVATGTFPVDAAAGKKVRYSGYIKTKGVTRAWAGLWWRVDGESGILGFDNMHDRGAAGTSDWKRYEIVLDVSPEVVNINFGVLHSGDGTAWFDSLKIEIDGKEFLGDRFFDLDFESARPKGFNTGGAGYVVDLDSKTAHSGKQSLRMRHEGDSGKKGMTAKKAVRKCRKVLKHLESSRDKYLKKASPDQVDWAIQNASVVLQCFQTAANKVSRDESMARNVKWILDHAPPGTKIVLWGHNRHVCKVPEAMGAYLDKWYGEEMIVLGFACNRGRYTAIGDRGLSTHDLHPAEPGSVEYYFHETGLPRFILDLRKASKTSPQSSWLTEPLKFRSIGALATEQQFHRTEVSKAYDALIYFEQTSPTQTLGKTSN